jgi:light-regulated signal transduction histidine kinase (bacteriophytochrome)
LDKDGNELLQVIVKNTIKMGQLIDDLLDFSRLGRKEMMYDECDMDNIVRDITHSHVLLRKENSTEVTINKLHPAKADYTMIRQVWVNLISNAFKYAGKRKKIVLKLVLKKRRTTIRYYIKDNGVGFDPAYKHKLFGVFQRLHKVEEFPGTGVGLAIVQRIISRHNGKVWADAQKDAGATFYFTLPK